MGKYLTTVKSAHWLLTPGLSMRGFPGTRVLQCIAVLCSVLQYVAERCSVLQVCCSALAHYAGSEYAGLSWYTCVAVCCGVLQCGAVWCRCVAVHWLVTPGLSMRGFLSTRVCMCNVLRCVAVCCRCVAARWLVTPGLSVRGFPGTRVREVQCVVVCCNVLWCVAVLCSVFQVCCSSLARDSRSHGMGLSWYTCV